MAVNLSPIWGAGAQLLDNSGNVLSGGKIYTYAAGTTTPAVTYTSSNGLTANSNPIILNSAGRVPYEIWLSDTVAYKFVLKDSNDTLIGTWDNLVGINSNFIAYTAQQEIQTATAGQTVFNLTSIQYQPGSNNLSIFVDGVNQYGPGAQYAYVETDSDTVTFVSGLHEGASVKFTTATPVASSATTASNVSITDVGEYYTSTNVEGALQEIGAELRETSETSVNYLWAGEFQTWPMGHAAESSAVQRVQCPAGVTIGRTTLADGIVVQHIRGNYRSDALRVIRTAATTNTSNATVVLNLTAEETKPFRGQECVLQFYPQKSSAYTGGDLGYRVQYSLEQEQPILNGDGTYTNGNVNLVSETVALTTTPRARDNPVFATFTVPQNATQVSVCFVINWVGTAPVYDYIDLEAVTISLGNKIALLAPIPFVDILQKSATRYQSTYNYGAPRGSATEQGAVQAVAITTNANWAFAINVDFSPKMAVPPQFFFQSPTSGTESRLLDVDAGTNINGLAFNLDDSGVTITNNAVAVVGNRYLCHWTAQAIF